MDHMFALMEEVRVLVGRLDAHPHIRDAISTLNYRVEELRLELSVNKHTLDKIEEERENTDSMFNTKRGNPYNEGSGGDPDNDEYE
jgi:hypothetical protein